MRMSGLYAMLVLGIQFFVHLVRRLLRRPFPGLETFLANYREDGIPAMLSEEKTLLNEIGRCVSCGLCDSHCSTLVYGNPADFMGPSFYPTSASRLIPDYPYARLDPTVIDSCRESDSICPRRVPIMATFEMMRHKVEAIAT